MRELQFKFLGGALAGIGNGTVLFRSGVTGALSAVSDQVILSASHCTDLATIDEHASRLDFLLRRPDKTVADWKQDLADAAKAGLLISLPKISETVINGLTSRREHHSLDLVGIPTRNRPILLKRLLGELAKHFQTFRRHAEVLVVDDSEDVRIQDENRHIVSAFRSTKFMTMHYTGAASRARFAALLSKEFDLPIESTNFALLGDRTANNVSTGSSRNAILLESVGKPVLFMDDDVRCRIAAVTNCKGGLQFGQGQTSIKTTFLQDIEEVEDQHFVEEDLLGLHEGILNLNRHWLETQINSQMDISFTNMTPRLLKRFLEGDATPMVSLMGLLGISPVDSPIGYFYSGNGDVERMAATESGYKTAMRSRLVMCGAENRLLLDQFPCVSYCMGVDNTKLLPPFMPLGRGQEHIFGVLVSECVSNALFGVIPRSILHEPSNHLDYPQSAIEDDAGNLSMAVTVGCVIAAEHPRGSSSASRLKSLATRLDELSTLSDAEFKEHVLTAVTPLLATIFDRINSIESQATVSHAKKYWRSDIVKIKEAWLRRLGNTASGGFVPGGQELRTILQRFARLLTFWPEIIEGTKILRAKGLRLVD